MNVLIVEDDPVAAELLSGALEEAGYSVVVAENGREAMAILDRTYCRMVISDWEMPTMDGLELCQAIRAANLGRYVYVMLLTARRGVPNLVEGLAAGADEFMSKPFDPEELTVRLRTAERILSLETRNLAIFALAKLAESRDPETGAHLERVRGYARVLALDLAAQEGFADRISPGFISLIYETSPLHDIGKVAIPDYVLLKPGRLDEQEFRIMKSHASHGAATLDLALRKHPDATFLRMARDIARGHHERMDGSGYPDGLAGESIPLCARIFAIADVYDALISRRVYKKAFSHDVAKNIILEGAGSQFDPNVIEAFVRCQEQFRNIMQNTKDDGLAALDDVAA